MLNEDQVVDLLERMAEAVTKLRTLALERVGEEDNPVGALAQRSRLIGKAEGVALAASYIRETLRGGDAEGVA